MVNGSETALEDRLRAEARRLGFAACGIAPAADEPVRAARLEEWLAGGPHRSMAVSYSHLTAADT